MKRIWNGLFLRLFKNAPTTYIWILIRIKIKKQLNMYITLGTSRHRTLVIIQKQTLRVTELGIKELKDNNRIVFKESYRIP